MAVLAAALVGCTDDGTPERSPTTIPGPTTTSATSVTSTTPAAATTEATTTSEPTTTTTATTTTEAACTPATAVAAWPLRRRLASLVVVGVDPSGTDDATAVVQDDHVGGVFVGGDDTRLLTSGTLQALRDASPTGLIVAVDEEGGRVQRVEGLDGDVPSAREMAATMTPEEVAALARRRGEVMARHGIDVDLAPVVDVSDQPDRTVVGDRSWSADPATVATYAAAYADGLLAAGVAPVLKHFPGHGAASGDTHQGAASTPPIDALRARDLLPYEDLLDRYGTQVAVMLGHLDVPGLTEARTPASLSPATVALLRDDYGFQGVIVTDDLSGMASITDRVDADEAAVLALAAGVDLVLLAQADVAALLDHLEAAVAAGRLDEASVDDSVARVLAWKGVDACSVVL